MTTVKLLNGHTASLWLPEPLWSGNLTVEPGVSVQALFRTRTGLLVAEYFSAHNGANPVGQYFEELDPSSFQRLCEAIL